MKKKRQNAARVGLVHATTVSAQTTMSTALLVHQDIAQTEKDVSSNINDNRPNGILVQRNNNGNDND